MAYSYDRRGAAPSKKRLEGFAREFATDFSYPLGSCDLGRGDCDTMSNVFLDYLDDAGVAGNLLAGDGFIPPLGRDANPMWVMLTGDKAFKKGDKGLNHVVVQVGKWVVDLTGAQFGSAFKDPIYPVSVFKSRWQQTGYTNRANRDINNLRRMLLRGEL